MKCPSCNTALTMSERSGIEIDYCPQCRGVWLDRGELDKIIERSASESMPQQKNRDDNNMDDRYEGKEKYYNKDNQFEKDKYYNQKKRKSFLGDIFDF